MQNSSKWNGMRVVILGAARQGTALARYLALHGAQVTINDRRSQRELQSIVDSLAGIPVKWVFGDHPLSVLDNADLLCLSGGVPVTLPIVEEAQVRNIQLSNDSEILLEETPCKVIGITGSAGKTTTTSLVGEIANQSVASPRTDLGLRKVWVGGNIGTPLISFLDEMKVNDLAIMELSSFQLEIMSKSPQVAAILNITPNHLDRHGTMEVYTEVKAHILDGQSGNDSAVLNRDDPGAWGLAGRVRGKMITFGMKEPDNWVGSFQHDGMIYYKEQDQTTAIMPIKEVQLRGAHNLLNVLAACAIARCVNLPVESIRSAIAGFVGVAHRLEFVRRWGGADWYNDSIATAPERAMAAIRSFREPLVLLAGGRDKDLPWEEFAQLVVQRVRYLILFGEAAEKIEGIIRTTPGSHALPMLRCKGLRDAIVSAADVVEAGDIVLLSPGGTSFDEFIDFEERGECFRQWVRNL